MTPTDFSQLIGNETIKRYLLRIIEKKTIGNSLLFAGPSGIGKSLFAQAFAALTICQNDSQGIQRQKIEHANHPDIHHYRPEGKSGMHSIHSLRQLIEEVYLPPFESIWKFFIIHEADRMLTYSANALLKTFEEPPQDTVIILLSSNPNSLLPTVLSRCRTIYFQPIPQSEIEQYLLQHYQLEPAFVQKIARFANGSLGQAIRLAEQGGYPNRDILLNALAKGTLENYKMLTQLVQTLTQQIETTKKQAEEAAKEELCKTPLEDLSVHQQHLVEKELEGMVAMSQSQEMHALFDVILSWYRDLHLLLIGGNRQYLINQDHEEALEQMIQKGNLLSFEKVQKAIEEARLSLQRSMSLPICLENLFLKLNLI